MEDSDTVSPAGQAVQLRLSLQALMVEGLTVHIFAGGLDQGDTAQAVPAGKDPHQHQPRHAVWEQGESCRFPVPGRRAWTLSLGEGAGPGGEMAGVGMASPLMATPSWGPVWALESDLARVKLAKP